MRERKYVKVCVECGCQHHTARAETQFCGAECKKVWNNRRAQRGVQIYDLMMTVRHDRSWATLHGVWSRATRLLQMWRDEDKRDREGRRSWLRPVVVMEQTAWAGATVVHKPK